MNNYDSIHSLSHTKWNCKYHIVFAPKYYPNREDCAFDTSYKPEDFSDVGQAEVLAKHFSNELRYSPATHFITIDIEA